VPVIHVSMVGLAQMMDSHSLAHVLLDILVTAAKSKVWTLLFYKYCMFCLKLHTTVYFFLVRNPRSVTKWSVLIGWREVRITRYGPLALVTHLSHFALKQTEEWRQFSNRKSYPKSWKILPIDTKDTKISWTDSIDLVSSLKCSFFPT
jgi:hypothetical protein